MKTKIILLPANNQHVGTISIKPNGELSTNVLLGQAQELYLILEDSPICVDDWVYEQSEWNIKSICQSLKNWSKEDYLKCPFDKKVIASTDKSLKGLPGIPQSFLQKYIKDLGKVKEVEIKMNQECSKEKGTCQCFFNNNYQNCSNFYIYPCTDYNNNVVIVEKVPEMIDKSPVEHMKNIYQQRINNFLKKLIKKLK
jgi:hypothetical protein